MKTTDFLDTVELLLANHKTPQFDSLKIMVENGELIACRPYHVKPNQHFIADISRFERSHGLASSKWSQIFQSILTAHKKGILK